MSDNYNEDLLAKELEKALQKDRTETEELDLKVLHRTQIFEKNEPDPVRKYISDLYSQRNKFKQPFRMLGFKAALLDACITQLRTEFFLSYDKFVELLKQNENLKTNTCSGKEYSVFMSEMINKGIIKVTKSFYYRQPEEVEETKNEPKNSFIYEEEKKKTGKNGRRKKGSWIMTEYELTFKPVVDHIEKLNQDYCDKIISEAIEGLSSISDSNVIQIEGLK